MRFSRQPRTAPAIALLALCAFAPRLSLAQDGHWTAASPPAQNAAMMGGPGLARESREAPRPEENDPNGRAVQRRWENASPEEKARIRAALAPAREPFPPPGALQGQDPRREEAEKLARDRWRAASPEERQRIREELRKRGEPGEFSAPRRPGPNEEPLAPPNHHQPPPRNSG